MQTQIALRQQCSFAKIPAPETVRTTTSNSGATPPAEPMSLEVLQIVEQRVPI
jgi:hypothetical protein